jgi:hypothetical protein
MGFKFEWKNKRYVVEGKIGSLKFIVLPDCQVLKITRWDEKFIPKIAKLEPVSHDYLESLPEELANIFEAPIARREEE